MAVTDNIKYDGPENEIIWRHSVDTVTAESVLFVDSSQEAVITINHKALDCFQAGKHTLSTDHLPLAKASGLLPDSEGEAFHCGIYYVNKILKKEVKFGFAPFAVEDALFEVPISISGCGKMHITVSNAALFLEKCLEFPEDTSPNAILQKLREFVSKHVCDLLVQVMQDMQVGYFLLSTHISDCGSVFFDCLKPVFKEYGLNLTRFTMKDLCVSREDYSKLMAERSRYSARVGNAPVLEERKIILMDRYEDNELEHLVGDTDLVQLVANALAKHTINERIAGLLEPIESNSPVAEEEPQPPVVTEMESIPVKPVHMSEIVYDPDIVAAAASQTPIPANTFVNERTCPACHNSIQSDALFCFKCGQKLSPVCSKCGTELPEGALFCHKCGTKVE